MLHHFVTNIREDKMYNNVLVKTVERHFNAGMADKGWLQITLGMKHLDKNKEQYDFNPSYDPNFVNGSAPKEGDYIDFDYEKKDRGAKPPVFNITEWTPSTERSNGGPQQVGNVVQQHVNGAAPPSASNKLNILLAPDKISMAIMGVVGRHVANMKDFPQEEELTAMFESATRSYVNGVTKGIQSKKDDTDWE
jgi:hypothetical protein